MTSCTITDGGGKTMAALDVDGFLLPKVFLLPPEVDAAISQIRDIRNWPLREDDVFICTYPKTGTHWVYDTVHMILTRDSNPAQEPMMPVEFHNGNTIAQRPSPRIFPTHLPPRMLPKDFVSKSTKVILVYRNPKDVAVSYYNFATRKEEGVSAYEGTWDNFFPLFLQGTVHFNSYFDNIDDWEEFADQHPQHPIHIVHYEDLHTNFLEEIKKIAAFLGSEPPETLLKEIQERCTFQAQKSFKMKTSPTNFVENIWRKGKVGGWKDVFSPSQSDQMDALTTSRMTNSRLTFRYDV